MVGFDGTEDGFKAVSSGKLLATIAQNPAELGRQSVQLMGQVLNGESVDAEVAVAVDTVDAKNIADFTK